MVLSTKLGGAPRATAAERDLVKVATFNINNINKRLDNLLDWLATAKPDVVSLQELKEPGTSMISTSQGKTEFSSCLGAPEALG
jgi:exonuclease III